MLFVICNKKNIQQKMAANEQPPAAQEINRLLGELWQLKIQSDELHQKTRGGVKMGEVVEMRNRVDELYTKYAETKEKLAVVVKHLKPHEIGGMTYHDKVVIKTSQEWYDDVINPKWAREAREKDDSGWG